MVEQSDERMVTADPETLKKLANDSFIFLFGIGGGSDVDTCSAIEEALCISESQTYPIVTLVGLGPRPEETPEQTLVRYADRFRPCEKVEFLAKDSNESPLVLFDFVQDKAPNGSDFSNLIFQALDSKGNARANTYGLMVLENRASDLGKLLEHMRTVVFNSLGDIKRASGDQEALTGVSLIAVDTGGDCLAPLFEQKAAADLWLDESSTNLVPVSGEQESNADVKPEEYKKPVMVGKGMKYVPTGTGFGDFSTHQFGYGNEKRDEFALRACRLSGIDWRLCVVGMGSDGETSRTGLRSGEKTIREKYGIQTEALIEDLLGMSALERVPKFKNPTPNKTPCAIMQSVEITQKKREESQEVCEDDVIVMHRGPKLQRRYCETVPSQWTCEIPVTYASKAWIFDNSGGMLDVLSG